MVGGELGHQRGRGVSRRDNKAPALPSQRQSKHMTSPPRYKEQHHRTHPVLPCTHEEIRLKQTLRQQGGHNRRIAVEGSYAEETHVYILYYDIRHVDEHLKLYDNVMMNMWN